MYWIDNSILKIAEMTAFIMSIRKSLFHIFNKIL
jgi:hypothetical protein